MGLSAAKQAAKVLLSLLSIADPDLALRRACAYTKLSVTVLRDAQWQGAKGNWTPLEERVRSLELQGVAPEMARRICGFPALESDALKRRRDGATEDGPASSSKVARATPANEVQSETDAESDGA
jgi:hypothetical protein